MGSQLRTILVKGIFVHLMDLITETQNLQVLQSDIKNASIQAHYKHLDQAVLRHLVRLCKSSVSSIV